MALTGIWAEDYRPQNLEQFIGNKNIKEKMANYIATKDIPHLLFSGKPGTGKTTLSKILVRDIAGDSLFLNASDENNIETIRTKVKTFAAAVSFAGLKIVVLDEADFLTPNAQAALRMVMEEFAKKTRFILTCNYHERIIAPIKSRTQMFVITPPSIKEVGSQMFSMLTKEDVKFEMGHLHKIVKICYPDIRKTINSLQQNVNTDGILGFDSESLVENDYKLKILNLLKQDKAFRKIRQLVADNNINDFTEIYTYLFNNIDAVISKQNIAIAYLKISEYAYRDSLVVDKEINFATMITELVELI